jgi:hypothetical protein
MMSKLSRLSRKNLLFAVNPPPIKKPIFLIGTVRSGTSILAQILAEHPTIHYLGFELSKEWTTSADINIACPDTNHSICPPLGKSDASIERINSVRAEFAKLHYIGSSHRDSRFLNKNPHLWNKLPFVSSIFPDATLVVISRDIRSTVASTKLLWESIYQKYNRIHYLPPDPDSCWHSMLQKYSMNHDPSRTFPGGDISVIAEYWLRTYQIIDSVIHNFRYLAFCKHSEFVSDPVPVLNRICHLLDIEPFDFSSLSKIDRTRNSRWQELLTFSEKLTIDRFIEFNYNSITQLQCCDTSL